MTRKMAAAVACTLSLGIACSPGDHAGAAAYASAVSVRCVAGSARDIGYWKTHESCLAPLLPIWLGPPSGASSVDVASAGEAVTILERNDAPANGINRLSAALLAAKLNITNGVDGSGIASIVGAADAFLAAHGADAWSALGATEAGTVASWTAALETFDGSGVTRPAPDTWRSRAAMPTARWWQAAASAAGKIYVAGGFDGSGAHLATLEAYDQASDAWTALASMPTPRAGAAAAAVNGKVYVIGGFGETPFPFSAVGTVEEYDPVSDQWRARAPMPTARGDFAAVAVDGKIYAVGGNPGHLGKLAAVEEYDPATDAWRARAPMAIRPRAGFAAAAIDGKIYVAGGVDDIDRPANNLDVYDPASNTWAARAPMPEAIFALSGAASSGRMYVFTGFPGPGSELTRLTQRYDPGGDAWTARAPIPVARSRYAAAAVGGGVFVIGGQEGIVGSQGTTLDSVEEYTPPQ